MEIFAKLFGRLLVFVYHCFDRIVINGYLSGLSRPEQVVYFFRKVIGVGTVDREVLSQRTNDYQSWVEAFARKHEIPIEWAGKGVRKEKYVLRWQRSMERRDRYGVYFIFKSMEQGPTFRCTVPKYRTKDPNHRILAPQRSRFTHYYFYIRDEVLGPIVMRVASFFYAIAQIEYCRNFIFKRHFPIHKIFERSCELALWRMTAHKISQIFGSRLTKKLKGKLHTTLEQLEHGHHTFRAYWKHGFVKQYEKFSTFLRNEICSNNLTDFGLRKGLDHLAAVRQKFLDITNRFAAFQAQCLNVHGDFALLQRLALPITVGTTKYPGIKIHDAQMIRLMEVLLHAGTVVGGWRASQLHKALLVHFGLSTQRYGLNQLRYDLRKMRAHGLLERDGTRYAYRLTSKGVKVALLFVLFHQRLCGPLANSLFHHRPHPKFQLKSPIEAAFHKADDSIDEVIQLLKAA